ASALRLARDSQDQSALAVVMDGVAAAALWTDASRPGAERAAVLLGAAHSLRGAFDHSSLDAPGARDTARQALGEAGFEAAYQRGRGLGPEEASALAEDAVGSSASAQPVPAPGAPGPARGWQPRRAGPGAATGGAPRPPR